MEKNLIYCGSDVIEQRTLERLGMYEYPDGVMVSANVCEKCGINCPKSKSFIQHSESKEQSRYKRLSF